MEEVVVLEVVDLQRLVLGRAGLLSTETESSKFPAAAPERASASRAAADWHLARRQTD